ncbi:MAG TPA: hypothetical protein GX717_03820 [Clostridiaceae bacterium]|nr:hypothetical protein [Clostridiaceae bacterium]
MTSQRIVPPLPQSTEDFQLFDVGTKETIELTGQSIVQRDALIQEIRHRAAQLRL